MEKRKLPKGWEWKRLKDVAGKSGLLTDGDWIVSTNMDPTGSIRLLQLADIGVGSFLDKSSKYINERKFIELNCTEVRSGDILISRMSHPIARACVVPDLGQKMITAVDATILRVDTNIADTRFVSFLCNSRLIRKQAESLARGATRKRISRTALEALEIPLPPLAEQRRIVARIEELVSLVEETKKFAEEAAQDIQPLISQKIKQEFAFLAQQEKYQMRLGEVCKFSGGSQPPKSRFSYTPRPDYIRLIQIRDYKSDAYQTFVPKDSVTKLCQTDDVMIGRYGPPLFQILRGIEGAYNVAIMKTVPDVTKLQKSFLFYLLQEPNLRDRVIKESQRSAGQTGIKKELLEDYLAPIPPLDEQSRVVANLDSLQVKVDELRRLQSAAKKELATLSPAILDKAFKGAL